MNFILGEWFGGLFSFHKEQDVSKVQLDVVRDTIFLLKPLPEEGIVLTTTGGHSGETSKKGVLVWDLSELKMDVEYFTERETVLVRTSEHEIVLGHLVRIPVKASEADTLIYATLHCEAAEVLVSQFLRFNISSVGLDMWKKGECRVCKVKSLADMPQDCVFISKEEDVVLEKSSETGMVALTLKRRASWKNTTSSSASSSSLESVASTPQHPWLMRSTSSSSPLVTLPTVAAAAKDDVCTPVVDHHQQRRIDEDENDANQWNFVASKSQKEINKFFSDGPTESLRKRCHDVRQNMTAQTRHPAPTVYVGGAATPTTPVAPHQKSAPSLDEDFCIEQSGAAAAPPPPPPPPPPLPTLGVPLPPPPPPPGGMSMAKTPVGKLKNGKKMRNFHWTTLSSKQGTFWDVEGNTRSPERLKIDESELESLFSITPTSKKNVANKKTAKGASGKGPLGLSLLIGFKRVNNAGIVLSRVARKMTLQDLKKCIIELKDDQLSLDQLRGLMSLFPLSAAETSALKSFSGDPSTLQPPEQFFYCLKDIDRVDARLECAIISRTLPSNLSDLRRNIVLVQEACTELRESQKLAKLMRMVYKLGHLMNRNSYLGRDGGQGFAVSSLLKLNDTKAKDKSTLLQYVVSVCLKQDPDVISFQKDLPSLDYAARISLGSVEDELRTLQQSVTMLKDMLVLACQDLSRPENSAFVERFGDVATRAERAIATERAELNAAQESFTKCVRFFGENPTDLSSDAFFTIIKSFQTLLSEARKQVQSSKSIVAKNDSRNNNINTENIENSIHQ